MGEKFMKDIDYIRIHNRGVSSKDWNRMVDQKKWDEFINSFIYPLEKSNEEKPHIPDIKNVIFHDPATIVWWEDGTKTVVKAYEDKFDAEKGLSMAIAKKALGNKGNYYEAIKKWVGDLMPGVETKCVESKKARKTESKKSKNKK